MDLRRYFYGWYWFFRGIYQARQKKHGAGPLKWRYVLQAGAAYRYVIDGQHCRPPRVPFYLRNMGIFLFLLCFAGPLAAQPLVRPCYDVPGSPSCQTIGANTPLYVTTFDSGAIAVTATPANSSHAAGTSIGGLFAVPLARVNGGSGILTSLGWKSVGGSTGQLVFRMWFKNPTNTTCTDNTAFAGSDTDDAFQPPGFPLSLTPAAPAVTTGDTATYAAQLGMTTDYKNVDTVPSQNIYVCAVTVATDTADENKIVRLTLSGPQN